MVSRTFVYCQHDVQDVLSVLPHESSGAIFRFRDLARNEEFSEIAVINIFFTVLKTKTQLSVGGGGPAGKISR